MNVDFCSVSNENEAVFVCISISLVEWSFKEYGPQGNYTHEQLDLRENVFTNSSIYTSGILAIVPMSYCNCNVSVKKEKVQHLVAVSREVDFLPSLMGNVRKPFPSLGTDNVMMVLWKPQ